MAWRWLNLLLEQPFTRVAVRTIFYPPLLRSGEFRTFPVGDEMLAESNATSRQKPPSFVARLLRHRDVLDRIRVRANLQDHRLQPPAQPFRYQGFDHDYAADECLGRGSGFDLCGLPTDR